MKETINNEFALTQKLTYEKQARRDLEVSLEVVLKSLQNVQVIISGHEVELTDVANMASYAISLSMILVIHDNMINGTNHIV
jgi:hypothetical protein